MGLPALVGSTLESLPYVSLNFLERSRRPRSSSLLLCFCVIGMRMSESLNVKSEVEGESKETVCEMKILSNVHVQISIRSRESA